jgi:hypothetical protein
MNRQEYWINKGYTKEQIENHLSYERYKSKLSRERNRRHNEKNKDIIEKIKNELLKKTFGEYTVISIRSSTDGVGFWSKVKHTYGNAGSLNFRIFTHFDDYSLEAFISNNL